MRIRHLFFLPSERPSCNVILTPLAEESSANTRSFTFRMTKAAFELLDTVPTRETKGEGEMDSR
jgi:hypothetical protein